MHVHSFSSQALTLNCSVMPFCCGPTQLLTLVLILLFLYLLHPLNLMVNIMVPAELPSVRLYFTQILCFRPPWLNLALVSPRVSSVTMGTTLTSFS